MPRSSLQGIHLRTKADDARKLLSAGEFPDGSMGPKVEACTMYVESIGNPAPIIDVDSLKDALWGMDGTWITR